MDQTDRIRRVSILCCHCVRNMAYYRGGNDFEKYWESEDFWINIQGNFIDIAVLEWCKLFADKKGKHYWKKVVPNPDKFLKELYESLNISESKFNDQIVAMKHYRDKFLGHLDEEMIMQIPVMEIPINSSIFLFGLLRNTFEEELKDAPKDLQEFYEGRISYAKSQCKCY